MPLTLFLHRVCVVCGAEATLLCGSDLCGAAYCGREHQIWDWRDNGHGLVCQSLTHWAHDQPVARRAPTMELSQEEIGGLLGRLFGTEDDDKDKTARERNDENESGFFSRLVGRYKLKEDESDGVFSGLKEMFKAGEGGDPPESGRLTQSTTTLKQLKANTTTTRNTKRAEDLWKETKGGEMTETLKEMKDLVVNARDKSDEAAAALKKAGATARKAGGSFGFVKRFLGKLAVAGFKVTVASGKVVAGVGTVVADVVGVPLDTLVDAVAIALDVAIFASTILEAVYGLARSFIEIKDNIMMLLTFSGGPPGAAAGVDSLFDVLDAAGLRKRAKQFMGSIVALFERVIRWGAPVVGSVIGLAIPYDAAVVGRVIEFFLYPIRWFISKGWLLISKVWSLLPESWQAFITDKDRWTELLVSLAELLKRLFPIEEEEESWKRKLIRGLGAAQISVARVHPLVIVGLLDRDKVVEVSEKTHEKVITTVEYVDTYVNRWIDDVLIPNLSKIPVVVHGALGLSCGLIYMLYAYTPQGVRRKIGLPTKGGTQSVGAALGQFRAHLVEDSETRARWTRDVDQRHHEMRQIMTDLPTPQGMAFIFICIEAGIPLDADAPYMGVPAIGAGNFAFYQRAVWGQ